MMAVKRSILILIFLFQLFFSLACSDYQDIKQAFYNSIYADISAKLSAFESDLASYKADIDKQNDYYQEILVASDKYFEKVKANDWKRRYKSWNYTNWGNTGAIVMRSDYTEGDAMVEMSLRNTLVEARARYEWSKICPTKVQAAKQMVDLFKEIKRLNTDYSSYSVSKFSDQIYVISSSGLGIESGNITFGQWNCFGMCGSSYEPVNAGATALYNAIHSTRDYRYEYNCFINSHEFDHDLPLLILP